MGSTVQIEVEGKFDHSLETYGGLHPHDGKNECCKKSPAERGITMSSNFPPSMPTEV